MKKSKFSFGPNGPKGFFLEHVEKMVLVMVLLLVVGFVYFGSKVETFPENKTPAALDQEVTNARNNIETKTWDKVKESLEPPSITNPIVINTKPDDFKLASLDEPILPSRTKRRDPEIYPPINLEVYAVTAPVGMLPREEEIMPIDMRYQEQIERQQQPLIEEDPAQDRKKRRRRPGDELDPFGGRDGRGGIGGLNPMANMPRPLEEEEREELMRIQARVSGQAVARSRNIVALRALIPYKKQLHEYLEALAGNPAYVNEERDTPTYVFFKVERADVTDDPNADPSKLQWRLLSTNSARNLPYVEGAEWETIPEELVDPAAVLAATERFGALTLPVPPVLLTDIKKLAGHPEIAWASAINGEGFPGQEGPAELPLPEGPEVPEGPETPEGPDAFAPRTGEGPNGLRPGGPGPRGPVRGPGRGGFEGAVGAQEVTYKLFRFIDFDVERGRQYRYRISLMLEDPNHPQQAAGVASGGVGRDGSGTPGNDPNPASLDKEVEQRLRELKKQEDETGRRIWYRETDWSEASPVVAVPDPLLFVGGAVTAGRETPVPGTTARVLTGEPVGKTLVVQWSDEYATNVVAQEEVQRGLVLNFTKDAEALHPIRLEYVELKDHPIDTDALVIDLRGGERLPGGDFREPVYAPGEIAMVDHSGRLIVLNEADDLELWHRYGKVEPKKVEEPEPEEGMQPDDLVPERRPRSRRSRE